MMRGFFRLAALATSMKRWPFSTPSMYPITTRVSGSAARASMKSTSEESALFPRLMNLEKPTSLPMAQSRMAVQRAPDWEKNPISPTGGIPAAKVAFRQLLVSITPRQFGPTTRIPSSRTRVRRAFSSAAPSPPTSLKPAEITMAYRMPLAAQASSAGRHALGGITRTARSASGGRSATSA